MSEKQKEKDVKEKKGIKQILRNINNSIKGDVIENLAYASIISIYLIFFNIQVLTLPENILINYINIASMIFLTISIIIMESSYKKEDDHLIMFSLEYLGISIAVLFSKYIPKLLNCDIKNYIIISSIIIFIYYILKLVIKYTIEKQNELKNLSDIREIVEYKPIKKKTKRKNINKEEEI